MQNRRCIDIHSAELSGRMLETTAKLNNIARMTVIVQMPSFVGHKHRVIIMPRNHQRRQCQHDGRRLSLRLRDRREVLLEGERMRVSYFISYDRIICLYAAGFASWPAFDSCHESIYCRYRSLTHTRTIALYINPVRSDLRR